MRIRRLGRAQQGGQIGLPWCRGQQIVAAHDLVDALIGIVDHDGEVVGRYTVIADQDEVIDRPLDLSVQDIAHGECADLRSEPERGRPLGPHRPTLVVGQVTTRPGIGSRRMVRR